MERSYPWDRRKSCGNSLQPQSAYLKFIRHGLSWPHIRRIVDFGQSDQLGDHARLLYAEHDDLFLWADKLHHLQPHVRDAQFLEFVLGRRLIHHELHHRDRIQFRGRTKLFDNGCERRIRRFGPYNRRSGSNLRKWEHRGFCRVFLLLARFEHRLPVLLNRGFRLPVGSKAATTKTFLKRRFTWIRF
jgi:hypothetical protein